MTTSDRIESAALEPVARRESSTSGGLYYEETGHGLPILLIHPAGATASTWGRAVDGLAAVGRAIAYDRRGYARSSAPARGRSVAAHAADAASLLEEIAAEPAVVVGTSAGAAIAVDLAVRWPELVRVAVAHEFPWRFTRHLPAPAQTAGLARIAGFALCGREADAAEALLRAAYGYRDGGSAWDSFPEAWRLAGRANARAALTDFLNSIRSYPSAADLATARVPIVCSYGSRSPHSMARLVQALAAAIPSATLERIDGAGHAAPFDATDAFVALVADAARV